ncbi:hypothetical protein FS837_003021 [Tulasnella sp. UAMH 9824]|nr:hypothetical protein FS837_003021 [Tulasnella sp. UAMH 9824]
MSAHGLFNPASSGFSLPKALEEGLTGADIQNSHDRSVHNDIDGQDGSPEEGLADSVKKFLLQKSHIGFGFDTAGDSGPRYTNRQIVADISLPRIAFTHGEEGDRNVATAYSSRSSAYLQAGWLDAGLAAKTPWVDVAPQVSLSQTSASSESQKHLYITGRYSYAHCTVSMKDYISQLKPHPEFKHAVMNALAIPDELERSQEVKRVLSWYGSMFVTSVELGGMKHSTVEKILDEKTTESTVRNDMNAALGKKFGSAEVEGNVGGGTENKQTQTQHNEFDSLHFHTVGGAIEAPGFVKWRESLSNPRKWGVTRVLEVQSAISLFDKETRLQLALAVFKTPLYKFRNHAGRHTLSTNPDPSKLPVNSDGPWVNYGPIGRVLTAPLEGASPCYYIYNGTHHGFNIKMAERNGFVGEGGFWDMGIPFYVQPTKKPGTVKLDRTWNPNFPHDNDWATTDEERANSKARGYGVDAGYDCYIYPM